MPAARLGMYDGYRDCLKSEKMYMNLIKLHLNDPGYTRSLYWNTADLAVVVVHHEKFLCEVARTGHPGIHVHVLTKCLQRHFHCGCNKAFACKMRDALAFCRAKGKPSQRKRLLHGKITPKTASAVKAVITAINAESILMASSEEGEAVEDVDAPSMRSPLTPGDMVGDAAAALQRLREAFGESQGSATACSSTSPHA
jgi:hypothetical protein